MINIEINRNYIGNIYRFVVDGHSGYEEIGKDIVCANVSTATQSVILGMSELLGIRLNIVIDDGHLECSIPEISDQLDLEKVNILLETMVLTLRQVESEYSDYVKMIEVED